MMIEILLKGTKAVIDNTLYYTGWLRWGNAWRNIFNNADGISSTTQKDSFFAKHPYVKDALTFITSFSFMNILKVVGDAFTTAVALNEESKNKDKTTVDLLFSLPMLMLAISVVEFGWKMYHRTYDKHKNSLEEEYNLLKELQGIRSQSKASEIELNKDIAPKNVSLLASVWHVTVAYLPGMTFATGLGYQTKGLIGLFGGVLNMALLLPFFAISDNTYTNKLAGEINGLRKNLQTNKTDEELKKQVWNEKVNSEALIKNKSAENIKESYALEHHKRGVKDKVEEVFARFNGNIIHGSGIVPLEKRDTKKTDWREFAARERAAMESHPKSM